MRASNISFYNPLNGAPYIGITEEYASVDSDGNNLAVLDERVELDPPNLTFTPDLINNAVNILNPADGTTITTMTYGEIYNVIYSLYWHLAALRDSA